jgi:hypothetical protein
MKKTLHRLGIVTVGLSLCLWSCKEQDGTLKPNEETSSIIPKIKEKIDFSVVDGRLKFESIEDFKAALSKTYSIQEMEFWEKKAGFTSLNETYKEFFSKDSEGGIEGTERVISKEYDDAVDIRIDKLGKKSYERSLSLPALATLTNHEGIVQIADKVLKFSSQDVKIAKVINDLRNDLKSNNVEVNKIIGRSDTKENKSAKVLTDYDDYKDISYPIPSGFAQRKFVVHKRVNAYNIGWWGTFTYLWFAGVTVEHQRNNWYGWGSIWIDGWTWDAGTCYVRPTNPTSINDGSLVYLYPSFWSSGSVGSGCSSIFLGQIGFFDSDGFYGRFGATCDISVGNITGDSFGIQNLGSYSFYYDYF